MNHSALDLGRSTKLRIEAGGKRGRGDVGCLTSYNIIVEKCTRRNINEIAAGTNAYRVEPSPTSARVTRLVADFSNISVAVMSVSCSRLARSVQAKPGYPIKKGAARTDSSGVVEIVFDGVSI